MKNRRTDRSRKTPDAEFENFRKRTEKKKNRYVCCGSQGCDRKILPVVDNFERGLDVAEDKEDPFVQEWKKSTNVP